jgi:hypothetical protein
MPIIPVNRVVDPKKNNWKKWRAKEEETVSPCSSDGIIL